MMPMKRKKPAPRTPTKKKITRTPTHKPGDGGVVVLPDGNIGLVVPDVEVQAAVGAGIDVGAIEEYALGLCRKHPAQIEAAVKQDGEFALAYVRGLERDRVRLVGKPSARIKAGLARAREKGKRLGRPPGSLTRSLSVLSGDKHDAALRRLRAGGPRNTLRAIGRDLKVSFSTVHRLAKKEGISRRKRNSPATS
jgi:hypothetical protein